MRVINLPAIYKQIPMGLYVKGIREAIRNPDLEYKHGLTTWWPTKGREIREQFMRGVHDRINQGIPYIERGKPS